MAFVVIEREALKVCYLPIAVDSSQQRPSSRSSLQEVSIGGRIDLRDDIAMFRWRDLAREC